jgi:hypothetical protein
MGVYDPSGIVIDDTRVTLQIVVSLTDDSRVVIYDPNMFKVQVNAQCRYVECHCAHVCSHTTLTFDLYGENQIQDIEQDYWGKYYKLVDSLNLHVLHK